MQNNQQQYNELFDNTAKIKAFDEISDFFYDRNFGSFSKTDMELLMFKFFMEAMIKRHKCENSDTIDYAACSDYKISKILGITQQRVRNMKVKKEITYPQSDFKWEKSFAQLLKNGSAIRLEDGKIRINIPDPNLFYAIQNFIEEQGGFIDITLNPKLMIMRQEHLIALIIWVEGEDKKKEILKSLNEKLKKANKDLVVKDNTTLNVLKALGTAGINVTTILANIATIASPSNLLIEAVKSFLI